jgi:hypothetical protein
LAPQGHDPFVADGRQRLREAEWYRRKEREVREAVRKKYEPELAAKSGHKQMVVYWKMQRELR